MKLPFLTIFLVFVIVLTVRLQMSKRSEKDVNKEFWERELRANSVRRKDIENLPYIPFDPAMIPEHPELEDERVNEYITELKGLKGKRILNCTGQTNTDLKLEYGAANITKLTEYDGNYTILVRTIARLAEKYLIHSARFLEDVSTAETPKDGQEQAFTPKTAGLQSDQEQFFKEQSSTLKADAQKLLEYGISIGTDVRLNYELLGQLYAENNDFAKIEGLKATAETLNSLSKEPILRMLDRLMPV